MKQIRKIGNSLYLEGNFTERDRQTNWACFIDFPTIFKAYGQAIKSGNWQCCTDINTPDYVIENYLEGKIYNYMPQLSRDERKEFWQLCADCTKEKNRKYPKSLQPTITRLNELLDKLPTL